MDHVASVRFSMKILLLEVCEDERMRDRINQARDTRVRRSLSDKAGSICFVESLLRMVLIDRESMFEDSSIWERMS